MKEPKKPPLSDPDLNAWKTFSEGKKLTALTRYSKHFEQEYMSAYTNNTLAAGIAGNIRAFFDGIPCNLSAVNVQQSSVSGIIDVGVSFSITDEAVKHRIKDEPMQDLSPEDLLKILQQLIGTSFSKAEVAYDDGETLVYDINLKPDILNGDGIYNVIEEIRAIKKWYRVPDRKSVEFSIKFREGMSHE